MKLTKKILNQIDSHIVKVPSDQYFALPEKVLQFGTGVLLRGLPDYFIDKANQQQIFNGRIVVVKSTATPGADAFGEQEGLYTHCVRGIEYGNHIARYNINASISRVLTAATQWESIIELASSKSMQIIISNTTESGLVLIGDDKILDGVPSSFPGKVLAFLYKRWQLFYGSDAAGMVVLPTELIPDNGKLLLKIINQLAVINHLEYSFITWLNNANHFCNTLVDCIVPGKLSPALTADVYQLLGYEDELMIMSEPFRLWAIESDHPAVKEILSFTGIDNGIVITDSIQKFRDLKLRLLNGTHSFSCAIALLAGFKTVKEAMSNKEFVNYLDELMLREISPCLLNQEIDLKIAHDFAEGVKERFANPFIEHKWISIAVNYTEKMRMRNIALILRYEELTHKVPEHMAVGFAAFLMLMKQTGRAFNQYTIDDAKASIFVSIASHQSVEQYVHAILADATLWGTDLSNITGFEERIIQLLKLIDLVGMNHFLLNYSKKVLE